MAMGTYYESTLSLNLNLQSWNALEVWELLSKHHFDFELGDRFSSIIGFLRNQFFFAFFLVVVRF